MVKASVPQTAVEVAPCFSLVQKANGSKSVAEARMMPAHSAGQPSPLPMLRVNSVNCHTCDVDTGRDHLYPPPMVSLGCWNACYRH